MNKLKIILKPKCHCELSPVVKCSHCNIGQVYYWHCELTWGVESIFLKVQEHLHCSVQAESSFVQLNLSAGTFWSGLVHLQSRWHEDCGCQAAAFTWGNFGHIHSSIIRYENTFTFCQWILVSLDFCLGKREKRCREKHGLWGCHCKVRFRSIWTMSFYDFAFTQNSYCVSGCPCVIFIGVRFYGSGIRWK